LNAQSSNTSVAINIDDGVESYEAAAHHGGHHDHSNCKDHNHSHGHGRSGHKHNHRHKWLQGRGLEIKIFVYGILVAGWAVVVFGLSDPVRVYGSTFDVFASNMFITFLVAMAIISYYRCTTLKNGNPTKQVPVNATAQTAVTCKTCNNWKPERTHHCSSCNECVLRMDHHCPWVCNCVGYKNHKSFVLFCLYLGFASVYYIYRSVYFIVVKFGDDTFFDANTLFLAAWFLMTLLIGPAGLMVLGLGFYHVTLAMNNLTTLEGMGGANMRTPCDSKLTTQKKLVNKYDKGLLVNLFEFFGSSFFLWWFPTSPSTISGGQYYEQIPDPTPTEVLDFIRGKGAEESNEEKIMKPKSLAEVDVEGILRIAEDFTKDKHLQFFNIMLEIGKRKDNTYKAPVESIIVKQEEKPKQEEVSKEENNVEKEEVPHQEDAEKIDKEVHQEETVNEETNKLTQEEEEVKGEEKEKEEVKEEVKEEEFVDVDGI